MLVAMLQQLGLLLLYMLASISSCHSSMLLLLELRMLKKHTSVATYAGGACCGRAVTTARAGGAGAAMADTAARIDIATIA